ncbi:hypothetical protein EBS43_02445 [bacterium]|nr:hypothetical protein [bacterium]
MGWLYSNLAGQAGHGVGGASLASASAISPANSIQEALVSLQTLRSIAHPNPHFMDTLQARITE